MSDASRVARNATVLIFAQAFNLALSFAVAIFIARAFGAELYGVYSFAITFTTIFATFSDLGYGSLLFREVSKDRSKANLYLNNILSINLAVSVIAFVVMAVLLTQMNHSGDSLLPIYFIALYALISSTSYLFKIVFRSFEKMEYEAFIRVATNIVRAVLVILSICLGYGLIGVSIASFISAAFDLYLSHAIYKGKFARVRLELDPAFVRSTRSAALSLGMLALFTIMYTRIDTVLLSAIKGDEAVGLYNAAYDLIVYARTIPELFLVSLFPTAMGTLASGKQSFYAYYDRSVKYLMAAGMPAALGMCLLSEEIIAMLYGAEYSGSAIILRIMSLSALLMFAYIALGNALISLGKEKEVAFSAMLCTCSNIAVSLLLIPLLGIAGAAIATIIGELVLLSCYCFLIRKYLGTIPLHKHAVRPALASIPMVGFAMYGIHHYGILEVITASIAIYSLAFLLLGGLDQGDRKLIRASIGHLRPLIRKYLS